MVKKAPTNSKLVMNTATKKEPPKTVINLSKTVSVTINYMLNGQKMGTVLPPTNRFFTYLRGLHY